MSFAARSSTFLRAFLHHSHSQSQPRSFPAWRTAYTAFHQRHNSENIIIRRSFSSEIPPPVVAAKTFKISGSSTEIPSSFEQAAGLERMQLEDPTIFDHNKMIVGPYGTEENPTLIPSIYKERIVACVGFPEPDDHEPMYMVVEKDKLCFCPICDQCFKLDQLQPHQHH